MHQVRISEDIAERLTKRRGRYHIYEEIDPTKAAFVVIDMQNFFCKPGAPAEVAQSRDIVDRINYFAAALRPRGVQVIWIVSAFDHRDGRTDWENMFNYIVAAEVRERSLAYTAPGAEGTVLWPDLDAREEDTYIVKNRYSCLTPGSSSLERVMRSRGIEYVMIGGTKTNICCESTCRDAFQMDFKPMLIDDCCAALSDREHLAALENVIQQFGDVMSADEALERLKDSD